MNIQINDARQNLIGHFVIVEAKDGKSTYDNGEYLVISQTPNGIGCVKPFVGYQGTRPRYFYFNDHDVFSAKQDYSALRNLIADQEFWIKAAKEKFAAGEKAEYIPSVYDEAAGMLRKLKQLLAEHSAEPAAELPGDTMLGFAAATLEPLADHAADYLRIIEDQANVIKRQVDLIEGLIWNHPTSNKKAV